ncbi:MAG: Hsp20/alpha crystallin family protein [Ferruginibacter sp.]|nr:Hsp20/alpha crystallin family protein [Bacteroidota bacterium]MBX2919510.1 Hsp20/alpha crystallin family protein [Ferruginibacter sp.]MBX2935213.1 Hsp20/alpha crystallin family protein [Ferruginibacter sp.]MCB0709793.1 Hsp20/alpha crystallin family protein [Chitinophagaceae bacterium]MCC7379968.1 Hsp20/alpha crystallin family protein [Chitinophagaceae bacterium]
MTYVKVNNPINKSFDGLMNELFNELPISFGKSIREDVLHFPPANIIESDEAYKIEMAVPGMDKADFNVKLDGNILNISSEKKVETSSENEKMVRKEFSYKSFKRSFTLDEKIDAANISAKYENGILKLELPKKEEVKNIAKEIAIQ